MNFTIFILVGVGLTSIITEGKIFEEFRRFISNISNFWGSVVTCPQCCGFWIGMFLSLTLYSPCNDIMFSEYNCDYRWYDFFIDLFLWVLCKVFDGSIISLFSWFIHNIIDLTNKKYEYIEKKIEYMEIKENIIQYNLERENNKQDNNRQ